MLIKKKKIDLFALFETKIRPKNFLHVSKCLGVNMRVASNKVGNDEPDSIWMCWDSNLWGVEVIKVNKQFIHVKASNKGGLELHVTAVYGSSDRVKRRELWESLIEISASMTTPWVVAGDFNEILRIDERMGNKANVRWARVEEFGNAINKSNLIELQTQGNSISWNNGVIGEGRIYSKLDRGFVNKEWVQIWPHVRLEYHPSGTSDHDCLILELRSLQVRKAPFRFTNSWLKRQDLRLVVERQWEIRVRGTAMYRFTKKLNNVKLALKHWARHNINTPTELNEATQELEQRQREQKEKPDCIETQNAVSDCVTRVTTLLQVEEEDWKQRSRVQWLKLGDQNSKFFAAMTRERKSTNSIYRMMGGDGTLMVTRTDMERKCLEYFQDLYQERDERLERAPRNFARTVTQEQNQELTRVPDREEIKGVVMRLNADKSPGPDGFNGAFFRAFWDLISTDLVAAIQSFFNQQNMLLEINNTFVTLVPKVKNAREISEFRPISCINTTYKIISKILTNRLVPIVQELVSPNQTAFLPGRLIGDNHMLATEMIGGFGRATGGANACIKVDLTKAYDTCSWKALEETLLDFNFSVEWVRLIMQCVSGVSYSFLVDGSPTANIKPGRGIRQGDPLSPYLFTLLMQNFTSIIDEKVGSGDIKLYKLHGARAVSHLVYADDLVVFCKARANSLSAVKSVFDIFAKSTGLGVSERKSEVFFSCATNNREELRQILGYREGVFPTKYLGLPLSPRMLTSRDCKRLIEVIESMVARWKMRLLSHAGRVQLFQWGIMGNFNFWNQTCRLPIEILNKIQKIAYNYIWDGKQRVSWEKMTLPKKEGGLGLRDFRESRLAAIIKRVWRIWTENNSIWASWMRERYVKNQSLNLISKRVGMDSALWAEIIDQKGSILNVMSCGTDRSCVWTGTGANFTYKNAWDSIRHFDEPDPLAKGVWSLGVNKYALTLWRARWGKITTNLDLALWNTTEDTDCYLCGDCMETQHHLFFRCEYSEAVWRPIRGRQPRLFPPNVSTLGAYMEEANRRPSGSPSWGLGWMLVGAITWALWCERNRRKHEQRTLLATELARRVLEDVHTVFIPSKYKTADTSHETDLVAQWLRGGAAG